MTVATEHTPRSRLNTPFFGVDVEQASLIEKRNCGCNTMARVSFSSGWATGTCPLLVVWRLVSGQDEDRHTRRLGWSSGTSKDLGGGRVLGEILGGPVERVAMGDIRTQAQEEPHGAHLAGTRGHRQRSVLVLFPSLTHEHTHTHISPS
jgi:hypothetical protein